MEAVAESDHQIVGVAETVELIADVEEEVLPDVDFQGEDLIEVAAVTVAYDVAVSYTNLRANETPEHLVCRVVL